MKEVLISIQPKWCELIASGRKTIEVRKTRPKIETPFKCYIYMTSKGNKPIKEIETPNGFAYVEVDYKMAGKVIGEFVCDEMIEDKRGENTDVFSKFALLSLDEQKKYGANKPLYGWHISDLKIYDKPKELSDFSKYEYKYLGGCCVNNNCKNYIYNGYYQPPECKIDGCFFKRPPQSWCYVKELL